MNNVMSPPNLGLQPSAGAIQTLSLDEVEQVNGAGVDWIAVGRFAGTVVRLGAVGGAAGIAAAGLAVAVYVVVDAAND
jgi:hypothetical protein